MTKYVWLIEIVSLLKNPGPRQVMYLCDDHGNVTADPLKALQFEQPCAKIIDALCNRAFPLLSDRWLATEHGFEMPDDQSDHMVREGGTAFGTEGVQLLLI